ncbi:hypothetical protein KDH_79260 [Dictyobacter sp. S3.2.2.5]|uniref:Uncharacterized protein n=1 Tax=Dictyobacter halimunensis TaxID=3026934 RepID=A0ABQ6G731_9CHLR|nr:hypothetical protein KDH_79260 [Dictyobacter sp. S3.2.2.5]
MTTTTLDIFVGILQKLLDAGTIVSVNTTMEFEDYVDEDKDDAIPGADPSDISFRVWKKIELAAEQRVMVDGRLIDDIEDVLFELSISPSDCDIERFCKLITELADAGHIVQAKVGEDEVRILELEALGAGKLKALYIFIEDAERSLDVDENQDQDIEDTFYHESDELTYLADFYVTYDEEEARFRLYPPGFNEDLEDAVDLYQRIFLPRMRAARAYGEVPGLIYH